MRRVRHILVCAVAASAVLGCSSGQDGGPEVLGSEETRADYDEQLAQLSRAPDDSSFPDGVPDRATGVYGYSRYVWTESSTGVVPLLVEGPLGEQHRCQSEDLPCSFEDLRELAESGDAPPEQLSMDREQLEQLVDQLQETQDFIMSFGSMDEACAAGYAPESEQNPNMGIHVSNRSLIGDGFDPGAPEMLLFAKEDGEQIPSDDLGTCEGDRWTGEAGFEVVGAAFLLPMTPEHPDAFTGPIDNWHIHYSACHGATSDAIQGDEDSCVEAGGVFFERTPVWMMHAYVAEGFDNQHGVFSMYNDTIWPLGEDLSLANRRASERSGPGMEAPIVNFDYGDDLVVDVGEPITFTNTDSLPHTVTGGQPGAPNGSFDSGVLGAGGAFTTEFDEPGSYEVFCALHPSMTATVTVED
jgi:plastocyanin